MFTLFFLFIYLGALFMGHEQCTRCWSLKKKKRRKKRRRRSGKRVLMNTLSLYKKSKSEFHFFISLSLPHFSLQIGQIAKCGPKENCFLCIFLFSILQSCPNTRNHFPSLAFPSLSFPSLPFLPFPSLPSSSPISNCIVSLYQTFASKTQKSERLPYLLKRKNIAFHSPILCEIV